MPEENIEDYFNMLPDQVKPQTPPTLIIDEDIVSMKTEAFKQNQTLK